MKTFHFTIALLVLSMTTTAAPLVYEGFPVPPYSGDIIGENGGFGWSGAWMAGSTLSTNFDSEPTGLIDSSLETTTGGLTVTMNTGFSAGIDRAFSTAGFDSTVYFGLLISITGHSTFDYFYDRLGSQLGNVLLGHIEANQWRASLQGPGDNFVTAISGTGDVVEGQSTHLILKLEFNQNGANERITLFVNPPEGAEPSVPAQQTRNDVNIGTSLTGALQLGIAGDLVTRADELRIGASYADMFGSIPEPTSMALSIFGTVVLYTRRARAGSETS